MSVICCTLALLSANAATKTPNQSVKALPAPSASSTQPGRSLLIAESLEKLPTPTTTKATKKYYRRATKLGRRAISKASKLRLNQVTYTAAYFQLPKPSTTAAKSVSLLTPSKHTKPSHHKVARHALLALPTPTATAAVEKKASTSPRGRVALFHQPVMHVPYQNAKESADHLPTTVGQGAVKPVTITSASIKGAVESAAKNLHQTQDEIKKVPVTQSNNTNNNSTNNSTNRDSSSNNGGFSLQSKLGLKNNSRFHINGFASAGALRTTARNGQVGYLIPERGAIQDEFNFGAMSLIGLQFSVDISHLLSATLQLVADGDDTNGMQPYHVTAEWAYLRLRFAKSAHTIVGRFRFPIFMYSTTQQVGFTYPFQYLPDAVYSLTPFRHVNGIDSTYNFGLGSTGATLKIQTFYGEDSNDKDLYTFGVLLLPKGIQSEVRANEIMGGVLSIGNPYFTLRGGFAHAKLSIDVPIAGTEVPLFHRRSIRLYSVGAKLNIHHIIVIGEYAHRSTPAFLAKLTGYYALIGYQISHFLPWLTYSRVNTNNRNDLVAQALLSSAELPINQDAFTLGLTYTISKNVIAKVSASRITPLRGTNGFFDGNPERKHVYLYGINVDAIF